MGSFWKSFWGGIAGKLVASLFIAVCFSLGFGPEKWAEFMIANLPSWITPIIAQIVFLVLGIIASGFLVFPLINFRLPWRISWDFSGNFISLSSQRHSIGTSGDMMLYGDVEYRINQFQVKGKNNSKKPIEDVSGYIQSNKTNRRIPILLESFPPEETHGIPGKCEFWVRAIFPKSTPEKEGYTIDDFWRHFGEFTFVFKYGTKKFEKTFSKSSIENLIEKLKQEAESSLIPKEAPRVVPRNSNDESRTQNDHNVTVPTFIKWKPGGLLADMESKNVTSIVDNGIGDFTVHFDEPLNNDYLILPWGEQNIKFKVIEKNPSFARIKIEEEGLGLLMFEFK